MPIKSKNNHLPLMLKTISISALVLSGSSYAASPVDTATNLATPSPMLSYPTADAQLGEKLYPDEELYTAKISEVIAQGIKKDYSNGHARRDAHPKAHGCVAAKFTVLDQIPNQLKKGIFSSAQSFPALIRFSNGSPNPNKPDIKNDARGMAIKLMNVPGTKLLEDEANASTQDFIFINHPVFFANEPKSYLSLMKGINGNIFQKVMIPFALGFKGSKIIFQTARSKIANPLQTRYWSMVPYQLGTDASRTAVKYSVRPCSSGQDVIPKNPDDNYLRGALKNTLNNGSACMEFLIQPRTSNAMSVEDSMTEWKESDAPFYKVATLEFAKQTFDTPAQNEFCENLSFSPFHALPAHKPLGVTNRMRKGIYNHISKVRHEMNSAVRQEP